MKPLAKLPAKHRWCNACGGDGRRSLDRRRPCRVCAGKGAWNADDIDRYHAGFPLAKMREALELARAILAEP